MSKEYKYIRGTIIDSKKWYDKGQTIAVCTYDSGEINYYGEHGRYCYIGDDWESDLKRYLQKSNLENENLKMYDDSKKEIKVYRPIYNNDGEKTHYTYMYKIGELKLIG